jgi:hypothetical protein
MRAALSRECGPPRDRVVTRPHSSVRDARKPAHQREDSRNDVSIIFSKLEPSPGNRVLPRSPVSGVRIPAEFLDLALALRPLHLSHSTLVVRVGTAGSCQNRP